MNTSFEKMLAMIEEVKNLARISSYEEIDGHLYFFSGYVLMFQNEITNMMLSFPSMVWDGQMQLPDNPTVDEISAYNRTILLEDIEMEIIDLILDLEEYKYLAEIVEEAILT